MLRNATLMGTALVLAACSSKPSAHDACAKLEAAGVAKNCQQKVPEVINARAKDEYVFDLPTPVGKSGHVLSFAKLDDYTATVKAYEALATLAGSHRYGSEQALVFVQLNSGASLEVGAKAKEVVEALASGGTVAPLVQASAAAAPAAVPASAAATPVDPADIAGLPVATIEDLKGRKKPGPNVTAPNLIREYEENEVRADGQYRGKRLWITGAVDAIQKDALDAIFVRLADTGRVSLRRANAYFADTFAAKAATLNKEDIITVECTCEGLKLQTVILRQCLLLVEPQRADQPEPRKKHRPRRR